MEFVDLFNNKENKKIIMELISFVHKRYKMYNYKSSLDVNCMIISSLIDDVKPKFKRGRGKKKLLDCVGKVSEKNMIFHWTKLIKSEKNIHNYVIALIEENMLIDADIKRYENKISNLLEEIIYNNSEYVEMDLKKREKAKQILENVDNEPIKKIIKTYEFIAVKDENTLSSKDVLYLVKYYPSGSKVNLNKQDEIKREIREFVEKFKAHNRIDLYIGAPYSLAFYVGKMIKEKSISNVHPWQKDPSRNFEWFDWSNKENCNVNIEPNGGGYKFDNGKLNVIVSISSNKNIISDVLKKQDIHKDDNVLSLCLGRDINNGGEAYNIANQIIKAINNELYKASKQVSIDLYFAAPLTIAYYMGFLSYNIDDVNIFEYIDKKDNKRYELALTI